MRSLFRPKNKAKTPDSPIHMVVGLRNPGADYEGSRHNAGYEVVERALARQGASLKRGPTRIRAELATVGVGDFRVIYVVPSTFMNDSGGAVRSAVDYHGVDLSRLLVIHDDIDLAFGRLRLQIGGGSGGHNGIRSVERALGTADFNRLKLGVGRPPGSIDPAAFVLRPFTKEERPQVDVIVEEAADIIEEWPDNPARAQEMAALRGRDQNL